LFLSLGILRRLISRLLLLLLLLLLLIIIIITPLASVSVEGSKSYTVLSDTFSFYRTCCLVAESMSYAA